MDKITVAICNYNTKTLTNACIKSIIDNAQLKNYKIIIFDNSNVEKFKLDSSITARNIYIMDNTDGKYANFDKVLASSPYALMQHNANNYASVKHAYSIQILLNCCTTPYLILLDSDTIVTSSLQCDLSNYITLADAQLQNTYSYEDNPYKLYMSKSRFLPYVQWFNVNLMKVYNLHYFDYSRIHGVLGPNNGNYYDTGASFYEDVHIKKIPYKQIDYHQFVIHDGHGSWNASVLSNVPKYVKDFAYDFSTKIQKFNLTTPRTYQEKIGWLKTYDYTDLKTYCADKLLLHKYSTKILGKDLCIPVKRIFSSVNELDQCQLKLPTVLKCNHGSGYNLILKTADQLNLKAIKSKISKWLADDFAMRFGEVHYHNIKHKFYEEQYMDVQAEYQFLCFNGTPKYCQVITDRFDKNKVSNNFYDMDFNFVDICNIYFPNNPNKKDKKPYQFDELKSLAKKLCKPFKLVRVDFYVINDQIYLGELTFTPGNGHIKFKNPKHDLMLGNMLQLNI